MATQLAADTTASPEKDTSTEQKDDCKDMTLVTLVNGTLAKYPVLQELLKNRKRRRLYGSCPITMHKNWRKYVATVSRGESRILHAYTSDVSLEIPAGHEGVYMMRIHTDHSRFMEAVKNEECLIGPLVELEHVKFSGEMAHCPHVIYFPHSKRDPKTWENIRVRRGDIYKRSDFKEIHPKETKPADTEDYCEIDEYYIQVHTNLFGHYTLTYSKNECNKSLYVFIFASIYPHRDNEPRTLLKMKTFLCSELYMIDDFRNELIKSKGEFGMSLIAEWSVDFQHENLDIVNTRVSIKLAPVDPNTWKPSKRLGDQNWNKDLQAYCKLNKKLSSLMYIEGPHMCRNPYPLDAMSTDIRIPGFHVQFEGKFDLTIHIPVSTKMVGNEPRTEYRDQVTDQVPFTIKWAYA